MKKREQWNARVSALAPLGERVSRRGAFIRRGEAGEGVKLVKTQYPFRKTRSLARAAGQIEKARDLRQMPTETERVAWHLLRGLRSRGFRFRRQHRTGPYVFGLES